MTNDKKLETYEVDENELYVIILYISSEYTIFKVEKGNRDNRRTYILY